MKTLITNAKIFYQHHLMDGEMLFDEHEILDIAPTIERQEDWQVVDGQGFSRPSWFSGYPCSLT